MIVEFGVDADDIPEMKSAGRIRLDREEEAVYSRIILSYYAIRERRKRRTAQSKGAENGQRGPVIRRRGSMKKKSTA